MLFGFVKLCMGGEEVDGLIIGRNGACFGGMVVENIVMGWLGGGTCGWVFVVGAIGRKNFLCLQRC